MAVLKCNQSTADSVFQDIIELKKEMKQLKWYEFKKREEYKYFIAFNEALYHFKLYGGEK